MYVRVTKGFKIIISVESSLMARVLEIPFVVFWWNLRKSMQDKQMALKTATEGNVIFRNEVSGLVKTSLCWTKIRAVKWKVPDQSSCTIYNFLHFYNMNWMVFLFSTKLKDESRSRNLPQATLNEKNGAIISYPMYVCNSNAFEIR